MKSYLHEMVTSYWSVKVFSFESFPLYGDLMKDLFLLIHFYVAVEIFTSLLPAYPSEVFFSLMGICT